MKTEGMITRSDEWLMRFVAEAQLQELYRGDDDKWIRILEPFILRDCKCCGYRKLKPSELGFCLHCEALFIRNGCFCPLHGPTLKPGQCTTCEDLEAHTNLEAHTDLEAHKEEPTEQTVLHAA